MLVLKPFVRISILSFILAFLLIFLGVKYHWGDHLQTETDSTIELSIPDKQESNIKPVLVPSKDIQVFEPEIVRSNEVNSLLASMNKEQITEHCINLLSQNIKNELTLELATVNCVVSNFQETFQNISNEPDKESISKRRIIQEQCRLQYNKSPQYSLLEKQLLIGICVSDNLNR